MNVHLADILVGKVYDAPYRDKIAGLVRLYEKRVQVGGSQQWVTKYYPIACKIADDAKCTDNDLMMPDAGLKSLIWFEDGGVRSTDTHGRNFFYISTLRIVFWLNLKYFVHDGCSVSAAVFHDLVSRIDGTIENFAYYQRVQVLGLRLLEKSADVFGKYSFDKTSFLLYPYDYFAVEIETRFSINPACKPEIELTDDPNCIVT